MSMTFFTEIKRTVKILTNNNSNNNSNKTKLMWDHKRIAKPSGVKIRMPHGYQYLSQATVQSCGE